MVKETELFDKIIEILENKGIEYKIDNYTNFEGTIDYGRGVTFSLVFCGTPNLIREFATNDKSSYANHIEILKYWIERLNG